MRMTIARKLWLGFGIFAAVLIITTLALGVNMRIVDKRLEELTQVESPTRRSVYEMGLSVTDISLAVLKYLDTSDPKYRKQAEEGIAQFGQAQALYDWLADTPAEKELGNKISGVYQTYQALVGTLMDARGRKEGDFQGNLQDGMKKFLDLRLKLQNLLEREVLRVVQQDFAAATEEVHRAVAQASLLIFTIALIGLIVGSGMATVISRGLLGSVQKLVEGTKKISSGIPGHKIDIQTKDEMGELGTAFNQMAEKLQEVVVQTANIQAEKTQLAQQMSAGAAHEVRNLMALLQQGADYLSKKSEDPDISLIVQGMNEVVTRGNYIVQGLSEVATSSEVKIEMERGRIVPRIELALSSLKSELEESGIKVVREFQPDLPVVRFDRSRIEQVFVNLFLNAIQAMPHQGGTLTIRAYTKKLTEYGPHVGRRETDKFQLGETALVVDVEDTGPGISKDILPRIFNPFFTTRRDKGGTGLGLSVVRSILGMHQGAIQIANRAEGGVRATVMLKTAG